MRKKIAAGNWKMNASLEEGKQLIRAIVEAIGSRTPGAGTDHLVILATPFITLESAVDLVNDVAHIKISAQNCHHEEKGAYTGEVSAAMIKSTGTEYVIIGHSERREYFAESNETLAKKVNVALKNDLRPIFCCGEKLEIREKNEHFDLVEKQIKESLYHLNENDFKKAVIAYEPVWAIGTGVTASNEQAQEMHKFIRNLIAAKYGSEVADQTTVLYGGSVNANNAAELFSQPDVDGGLVGGASLKATDFITIVNSLQ
jgi:triosephosphate isomerase (TIM)